MKAMSSHILVPGTAQTVGDDGNEYDYVLCSSDRLRQMIDNPPVGTTSSGYFFFTI